jgi:putative DNA primase/helicase
MNNLLLLSEDKIYDFNCESIRDKTITDYGSSCSVKYDPDAKSELFDKFINDFTLGRQDIKDCLQEFFGMSLMGDSSLIFKKFLFLYGDGGDNGKSLFVSTLQRLFGFFTTTISNNLNDYHTLINQRLVVLNESDFLNKGFIKRLIGGDSIHSGELGDIRLQCRLVIVSNKEDDFNEDNTMKNRCIYVPCLMRAIQNPTEAHHRKVDYSLFGKLNDPIVSSAMLNWLIEGALRFKRQGYVTEPIL